MALEKTCDYQLCRKRLKGDQSFIQTRGTISDQIEREDGSVSYRYLTRNANETHTYCNEDCEKGWRNDQRNNRYFIDL